MSNRPRSPRRRFEDSDRSRPSSGRSGYSRNHDRDEHRERGYDNRHADSSTRDKGREHTGSRRDYDDRHDGYRREYNEDDRERERARDRERYDRRDREREHGSSYRNRRSASPTSRDSQPRGQSRSKSPQPSTNSKPNFKPSGLLAAETNTVKATDGTSTVLKYNEPPEARKPLQNWRLYVFKDANQEELLHIYRQSAYLVGRDRLVADIALDHPSCSKQHAAIQYRYIQEKDEYGSLSKGVVKPFIIDLESTNGTSVNDEAIPAARYYELKAGDVIKFGLSQREYVLLHDDAAS